MDYRNYAEADWYFAFDESLQRFHKKFHIFDVGKVKRNHYIVYIAPNCR